MGTRRIHIFRAGRQTTRAGAELEFAESDLAASVAAYKPSLHEAPICIGHPAHNLPAYGWIAGLSASGRDLFAEPRQVNPEFAEMVKAGAFKKVSAAFYGPDDKANPAPGTYYLRHVAFLGAQPPAIKGLAPVEFAAGDEQPALVAEIEFSDPAIGTVASMFRGLRDFLIEQFGLAKADTVLPTWSIDSVERLGHERADPTEYESESSGAAPMFSEAHPHPKQETTAVPTPRETELEAQLAAAQRTASEAQARLATAESAAAAAAAATRRAAAVEFAESLVAGSQLLPRDRDLVASVIDAIDGAPQPIEFGEGDAKQPLGEALRTMLKGLPKHGLNAEHIAAQGRQPLATDDAQAIAAAALEFSEAEAKAGRHVGAAAAVQHVLNSQGKRA